MDSNHQSPVTSHQFSAVIITLNAADTIGDCLAALQKMADDIVVLDSFSTDGTVEVCEKYGARIFPQKWLGYSATKNLGNSFARHDWILSIDSDEVLSDELIFSINNLIPEKGKIYALDRITHYEGKWVRHSGWYPDWKVRIFHKKEVEWQGDYVHETLNVPKHFQEIKLKGKLFHYSYKDADDHIRRIKKYARLSAEERYTNGKKANFVKLYLSPIARFFSTYILKKGFLDGHAGWNISRRDAYMVWIRYRILRDLWKNNSKSKSDSSFII